MDSVRPTPRAAVEALPEPLRAALHALAAPPSLVAIGLLLANDHLFKRLWPGWLTGKLSDLAGLYFAPYLFLAGLLAAAWLAAWVWGRLGGRELDVSAAAAGALAAATFALTGLGFAALKLPPTSPAAQRLLALTLGRPVAVAVDPTDLLALGVLPLSYLGWRRAGRAPQVLHVPPALRRAGQLLLLTVATLAVTATTPPAPPPYGGIAAIVADPHQPGALYASRVRYDRRLAGSQPPGEPALTLFTSSDNGASWHPAGRGGERLLPDPGRPGGLYLVDYDGVWRRDGPDEEPHPIWPPDGETFEGDPERFGLGLPAAAPAWEGAPIFLGVSGAVLRSDDAGVTWAELPLPGSPSEPVTALAAAPSQPGLLYVARGSEILRSVDGGATWATAGDAELPLALLEVYPQCPDLLLGGCSWVEGTNRAALLRSEDGGATWQEAYRPGAIWALAFDPAAGTAYAAAGWMGVLSSADGGRSWRQELPYCLFDLDVRGVTVSSAGRPFFAGEFGGKVYNRFTPGIYRRAGWPWLRVWVRAQAGVGSAPRLPLAPYLHVLRVLAGLVTAGLGVALAASRRLRATLAANHWETAVGIVGAATALLHLAALISGPEVDTIWALLAAPLLGLLLLALAVKAPLTGATWLLSGLPLLLLVPVENTIVAYQAQGLESWLTSYNLVVLVLTLGGSALQSASANYRSAKAMLIAAIVAVNAPLWLYGLAIAYAQLSAWLR